MRRFWLYIGLAPLFGLWGVHVATAADAANHDPRHGCGPTAAATAHPDGLPAPGGHGVAIAGRDDPRMGDETPDAR